MALLWVLIFCGVGFAASTAPAPPAETFTMPGTESGQALDLLKEKFPTSNADGASAHVVVRAPVGERISDPAQRAKVEKLVADLGKAPQVAGVADPFKANVISSDGSTTFVSATYKVAGTKLTKEDHDGLTRVLDQARESGLVVEAGGDAVELKGSFGGGSAEAIGILISAVVLLLTFGSMIAAGMPLLTAIIGVGIGISGITALGSTLGLSNSISTLALMLGLAVGIDYALFIVSRYRSEMTEGRDRVEAAGRAVGTAGSAVVFAGLTVIIALAGLAVVNIPMLTKMGLAAAATVAVSVLIAITLIPALLGFAPIKVLRRRDRKQYYGKPLSAREQRKAQHRATVYKPNRGAAWAGFVLRHPVAVLLLAVASLGVIAIPAASIQLGLPGEGTYAPDTTQRKAYDMLSQSFGAGFNGPLMVMVEARDAASAATSVGKRLAKENGVAFVSPATANAAGDTAILNVTPTTGPADKKTEELVRSIRNTAGQIKTDTGAKIQVTGLTALFIDYSKTLTDALLPYLTLVVGLAFLLLMIVFRSILVPLKAALGFLLSIGAALGAVVAVFQWGWLAHLFGVGQPGPVMSQMPIFMIGMVFGLAMDYEVFLVTRMREAYVHGARPGEAVVTGFRHGGRVVAAAAIIMTSIFGGFILGPNDFIKMIGFGLAVAVLFDAFIVRMAIVPALFAILGKAAWWMPKWLNWLPNMDVEGEKLSRRLSAQQQAPKRERELDFSG